MKKIKLFGITTLLICLVACGQTTQRIEKSDIPTNWKMHSESGYSIQYPDSFDLDISGRMGMSFILLSKKISTQDLFSENINLMIQDLSGYSIDLDKYVEISEGQVKTLITNGNIIDSKRIKEGNSEFQEVVYTGDQGQFKLKFDQYYWINNGNAYVLTLTCEFNQFDKYKEVGKLIMNSFKIK